MKLIISMIISGMSGILTLVAAEVPAAAFNPQSLLYVLQAEALGARSAVVKKLAASNRDLIVIDYSFTGAAADKWTADEIRQIRGGKPGRKVVAYLSIGEAENYRSYWRKEWDADKDGKPDKAAPPFLEPVNPDWTGNYKVKYWHPDWRKILIGYLDEIITQDFDGVYLDVVDAFEYFELDRRTGRYRDYLINSGTGKTFRKDMTSLVKALALHARKTKPEFLIIPQNGVQLLEADDYAAIISAIGCEDVFSDGDKLQKKEHSSNVMEFLEMLKGRKPVFIIEYAKSAKVRQHIGEQAAKNKYIILFTDRDLKTMGSCGAEEKKSK